MFEAISTGKNSCYGSKNEKVKIGNDHTLIALRHGWIKPETIKYIGDSKFFRGEGIKKKKVAIMPEKKVYILKELELQNNCLKRIEKELKYIKQKRSEMKKLLTESISNTSVKGEED